MLCVAAAGIISIGSWLMIASGTLCGQIVERFGRRDMVLALYMTGAVLALWILSLPNRGIAANLLFGLVGMAPSGVIMSLAGLALRPEVRAFGMGVFFTIYYAIMLATPPVAGAIPDTSDQKDLSDLFDIATELGPRISATLVAMLPGPAMRYGKAALVDTAGAKEHGAALLHYPIARAFTQELGQDRKANDKQRCLSLCSHGSTEKTQFAKRAIGR